MKIVFIDAGIFFRHQCELVLRHQMLVSNYFVTFFYSDTQISVADPDPDLDRFRIRLGP
jgi:hypothetical protein